MAVNATNSGSVTNPRPVGKELVRIIIDSVSSCRMIQNDVIIPAAGDESSDVMDTIDLTNTREADNTGLSDNAEEDDLAEDVGFLFNGVAAGVDFAGEEGEASGDHNYTVLPGNADNPQAHAHRRSIRRGASNETKQEEPETNERDDLYVRIIRIPPSHDESSAHTGSESLNDSVPKSKSGFVLTNYGVKKEDKSQIERVGEKNQSLVESENEIEKLVSGTKPESGLSDQENETGSGKSPEESGRKEAVGQAPELNWDLIHSVTGSLLKNTEVSEDGAHSVPKQIHVQISDVDKTSNSSKAEIRKRGGDSCERISPVEKLQTCAYCGEVLPSINKMFAHYDKAHEDGLQALTDKCARTMGAKTRTRKELFDTCGASALELKMTSFAKAGNEEGQLPPEEEDPEYEVCRICYFRFPVSLYIKHVLLQHYWARVKQLQRQKKLNRMKEKPPKPQGPFYCDQCGDMFNVYEVFCVHMWKVHSDTVYRKELIPEVKDHEKRVLCNECGRSFKSKHSLHCHTYEFHSGRPKRPPPPKEGKKFHCDLCSYETPEHRRLKAHINKVHMGINAYKCPFCTYTTNEHTALRHHKYTHSSEKPLSCAYCSFKCVQKHDVRAHLKRSHGVTLTPVRALKAYHSDPEQARLLRRQVVADNERHFRVFKDPKLHSCRGNEYYDVPFDEAPTVYSKPTKRMRLEDGESMDAADGDYFSPDSGAHAQYPDGGEEASWEMMDEYGNRLYAVPASATQNETHANTQPGVLIDAGLADPDADPDRDQTFVMEIHGTDQHGNLTYTIVNDPTRVTSQVTGDTSEAAHLQPTRDDEPGEDNNTLHHGTSQGSETGDSDPNLIDLSNVEAIAERLAIKEEPGVHVNAGGLSRSTLKWAVKGAAPGMVMEGVHIPSSLTNSHVEEQEEEQFVIQQMVDPASADHSELESISHQLNPISTPPDTSLPATNPQTGLVSMTSLSNSALQQTLLIESLGVPPPASSDSLESVLESAHVSNHSQPPSTEEQTYMLEVGKDEFGNEKFIVISAEQLKEMTEQGLDIKQEGDVTVLDNDEAVTQKGNPTTFGEVMEIGNSSAFSNDVTGNPPHVGESVVSFQDVMATSELVSQSVWNDTSFTLKCETGIPTEYSA